MLIGVYNGDDKITELRIITVCNLSTMLWWPDYRPARSRHLPRRNRWYPPGLGMGNKSDYYYSYTLITSYQSFIITIACTQYRRIMTATFTQKTFVHTKAVNKTTDNTMAKWKRAIISEISSGKNIHLKQQLSSFESKCQSYIFLY
jgi:hypothetical protein